MRIYGYLLLMAAGLLWPASLHAASWSQRAFHGQYVSWVEVDSRHPNQVAAQVGGVLRLSSDSGVGWMNRATPASVRSVKFDPLTVGRLYIATDEGLYRGEVTGYDWTPIASEVIGGSQILSLAVSMAGIYVVSPGEGNVSFVYSIPFNSWHATRVHSQLTNPVLVAYSESSKLLILASSQEVVTTRDGGASWRSLTPAGSMVAIRGLYPGQYDIKILTLDSLYSFGYDADRFNLLATIRYAGGFDIGRSADAANPGLISDAGGVFYLGTGSSGMVAMLSYQGGPALDMGLPRAPVQLTGSSADLWVATVDGIWVLTNPSNTTYGKPPRPVIVIPGMLGSWPTPRSIGAAALGVSGFSSAASALALDPFNHTYDSLVTYLEGRGYAHNETLFTFPYEWRQDNSVTARQLARRITAIKERCLCGQVDIVAHSMGGLVARSYIEGAEYQGDIKNLVQIATPGTGSVSNYEVYQAGVIRLGGVVGALGRVAFSAEAAMHGYAQLAPYIREKVLSVGQLLPVTDYIRDRLYVWDGPYNPWLTDLNSFDSVRRLKSRVNTVSIVSASEATPAWLTVGPRRPQAANWPDGAIAKVETSPGDGTVTLQSASFAGGVVESRGDHGSILSDKSTLQQLGYILMGDAGPTLSASTASAGDRIAVAANGVGLSLVRPGAAGMGSAAEAVDRLVVPVRTLSDGARIVVDGVPGEPYEFWYSASSDDATYHVASTIKASGTAEYELGDDSKLVLSAAATTDIARSLLTATGQSKRVGPVSMRGIASGALLATYVRGRSDLELQPYLKPRDGPSSWSRPETHAWRGRVILLSLGLLTILAVQRLRR